MSFVIDRVEEGFYVCEDLHTESKIILTGSELPEGVAEGDVLLYKNGEWTIDYAETASRRELISKMMNKIF